MFLSKISIVPSVHSAAEIAKLSKNGVYASHQLLWTLFSGVKKRTFLYREEQAKGSGKPLFYMLSKTKPDSNMLLFDVQSKEFSPKLKVGQRLGFKLRVNPTVCVTDETGKRRRHDVLMHAKYQAKQVGCPPAELKELMNQAALNWIGDEKRLSAWGMTLDFLPEIDRYMQHRSQKKNGQTVCFSSVDFQGVLTIYNPQLFYKQYIQGFGRSKSMGCGLMLIRPV